MEANTIVEGILTKANNEAKSMAEYYFKGNDGRKQAIVIGFNDGVKWLLNMLSCRKVKDKHFIAQGLRDEGYSIREIAKIMGFKHPGCRQFMEESKEDRWFTTPYCHGNMAFASWEYQTWLEEKLAASQFKAAAAPQEQGWISVEDRLPEIGDKVIVYRNEHDCYAEGIYEGNRTILTAMIYLFTPSGIKHCKAVKCRFKS